MYYTLQMLPYFDPLGTALLVYQKQWPIGTAIIEVLMSIHNVIIEHRIASGFFSA